MGAAGPGVLIIECPPLTPPKETLKACGGGGGGARFRGGCGTGTMEAVGDFLGTPWGAPAKEEAAVGCDEVTHCLASGGLRVKVILCAKEESQAAISSSDPPDLCSPSWVWKCAWNSPVSHLQEHRENTRQATTWVEPPPANSRSLGAGVGFLLLRLLVPKVQTSAYL